MEIPAGEKHGGGIGEEVCLITGATSGIGRPTAMGLANVGASVVMVDRGRGEAVMAPSTDYTSISAASTADWTFGVLVMVVRTRG